VAAGATGVIRIGAAARCGFGAGFLAAALGGGGAVSAEAVGGAPPREVDGAGAPEPGSGLMMLTAGVEDALGKSMWTGLPVGADGGRLASAPIVAPVVTGAFQVDA